MALALHSLHDATVIIERVHHTDGWVVPSVIHEKFAATPHKGVHVGTGMGDEPEFLIGQSHGIVDIHRVHIEVRVLKHAQAIKLARRARRIKCGVHIHPVIPAPPKRARSHRPAMIGCLPWLMYPSENFIMSFACGAVRQVAGSCPSLHRSCSGLNWHCRRSLSRKPSSRLPSFAPHCFNTVVLTSDNAASVSLFSLFTA